MRPLVSASQAADLDRRIRDEVGVPEAALMENAAAGMEAALDSLGLLGRKDPGRLPKTVTALVGKGNNGGDALAVLRRLAFSSAGGPPLDLAAVLSSGEPSGLPADQLRAARGCGVRTLSLEDDEAACLARLEGSELILDGIAGTGLSGPLRPREARLVEAVAACGAPVAAVDVPSGLGDGLPDGAPAVRSGYTLCVAPVKACLYRPAVRASAGRIVPISGVFPRDSGRGSAAVLMEPSDLAALVPPLEPGIHKYGRGHCLVFAGDTGTSGAAVLAARGTTAGGAGLVSLYARPSVWSPVASSLAGELVRLLPEDPAALDLSRADAAVLGPGWGTDAAAAAVLGRLWASPLPLVLDADALVLLRRMDLPARREPVVLTPHPGEAERLSGEPASEFLRDPEKTLSALARRWGAVVVLKSWVTWIADPEKGFAVYDGMDGSLAVGGSGDVLAGILGALLARGLSAFDAAKAAVLAHGSAGAAARAERGHYGADALPGFAARILGGAYGG